MNSFNIIEFEFLSYRNYNPFTKYTIALASHGAVHYNGSLVIVFTFEIVIFKKYSIFIYIFFDVYIHTVLKYIL